MPPSKQLFDSYLGAINVGELKSIARIWGVRSSTSLKKPDLLEIISQRLGDPERVRAAIEILTPFERTALALIGWAGYPLEAGALATGLRTAGGHTAIVSRDFYRLDGRRLVKVKTFPGHPAQSSVISPAVTMGDVTLVRELDRVFVSEGGEWRVVTK